MSLHELLRAGIFLIKTVGEPGIQGAVVMGMQGIGVKTPSAAAVAAATVGLAKELHMPKGKIFTMGILSMMLAKGILFKTMFLGSTINCPGAMPKEQASMAPPATANPIFLLLC